MKHEEVPDSSLLDEPVLCFSDLHLHLQLCAPHYLDVHNSKSFWKLYGETLQSSATIPSPSVVHAYCMSSILN